MKIVTHDSSFHTDDTFAVAVLLLKFPNAEVLRSRDTEIQKIADYLVDTGMVYDPTLNKFDHHMPQGAGERENGIPYASFGLVWKEFGEELAGGKREAEIIDQILVQPVDAHDNGVAITEAKFDGLRDYTVNDFLYSYLKAGESNPETLYKVFMNNVSVAQDLLKREIIRAKDIAEGEAEVMRDYENCEDKRIVKTGVEEFIWVRVLPRLPEPIFVLYKRKDNHWGIRAVPDIKKPYGNLRRSFPVQWGGKEGSELQEITGVRDAVFAHRALFMAVAKSKEGALALAQKALNA